MRKILSIIIILLIIVNFSLFFYEFYLNQKVYRESEEELEYFYNDKEVISSQNPNEYIKYIFLENRLKVWAKSSKREYYMLILRDKQDRILLQVRDFIENLEEESLLYEEELFLNSGDYNLSFYYGQPKNSTPNEVSYERFFSYDFKLEDGEYSFKRPIYYQGNLEKRRENQWIRRKDLGLRSLTSRDRENLEASLKNIVAENYEDIPDYKKAFLISSWVSKNIHYDKDYLEGNRETFYRSLDVMENRRAVCTGYANLTDSLLKAANIPSRLVIGYALTEEDKSLDQGELLEREANHIWNEAFIDNRWVIIDTTWNSKEVFRSGEYISSEGLERDNYFDISLEAFSMTHKIMEID